MSTPTYPLPTGLYPISDPQLDLRPDTEVDHILLHPAPITPTASEKNIWFFWHTGFSRMHGYTQRNIRAWHRRLSPLGWTVRVLDRVPNSPLNVSKFLDIEDPNTFPQAFLDGTIGGDYAPQHTSDLVRWPLLLRYGGIYADVGLLLIGDLDRLWGETVGAEERKYEVLSFNAGGAEGRSLTNYFLGARKGNPLFERCQRLLLELWKGKSSTEGMHGSPLLKGLPLMGGNYEIQEGERKIGPEEVSRMLTDYIIQGQVMTMVMGLVDEEDGWDGPRYVAEHLYGIEFMVGSQLINEMLEWSGTKAFELMSLEMPKEGEEESEEQRQAREVVEACLQKSFAFKLAHGLILRVYGDTLGSLWRKHEGSDDVPGTYAHWLRHGTIYWNQDHVPPTLEFKVIEAFKRGPLLRDEGVISAPSGKVGI